MVGMQRDMQATARLFLTLLGHSEPERLEMKRINAREKSERKRSVMRFEDLGAEVRERLTAHHEYDLLLYEEADKVFEAMLAKCVSNSSSSAQPRKS